MSWSNVTFFIHKSGIGEIMVGFGHGLCLVFVWVCDASLKENYLECASELYHIQ